MKRFLSLIVVLCGLTFSSSVSADQEIRLQMQVFPNPSSDFINITVKLPEEALIDFQLTDISGKKILAESRAFPVSAEHMIQLNLDYLPSGVYFIKVRSGKYAAYEKLVVNR